ncbi:MAG: tRNA (adenosine(37)-N6)-dimethylallyltransferase MiaA [Chloroflexi bacterium]|nr:tRNA (adenosine(37)-N6)-dimethylallyltransferase MiaA [Chloroflexota bacterium]
MNYSTKPKLIAVVGPTATGKTSLGIDLALQLDGEVVNADSRLFYYGMDVATAKPTQNEIKGIPHHLIDFLSPSEQYNLAEYLKKARLVITEILDRGKVPILVGGSGQYVWAIIEGWKVPEIQPDPSLRSHLELKLAQNGIGPLAEQLAAISPITAETTDLRNPRRVIRAIERVQSKSINSSFTEGRSTDSPFDHYIVGLMIDRTNLHARVLERLDSMDKNGWKQEVELLLQAGYSTKDRALSAIGYPQMISHLNGECDFSESIRLTAVATNRLIRHQNNWFKQNDTRINWFDMTRNPKRHTQSIISAATKWLGLK